MATDDKPTESTPRPKLAELLKGRDGFKLIPASDSVPTVLIGAEAAKGGTSVPRERN